MLDPQIERMYSRVQQPCKFIGTKESVNIRKELSSTKIGLVHSDDTHFVVLEHHGCLDTMCIRSLSRVNHPFVRILEKTLTPSNRSNNDELLSLFQALGS